VPPFAVTPLQVALEFAAFCTVAANVAVAPETTFVVHGITMA
jgi:hypothetical protein